MQSVNEKEEKGIEITQRTEAWMTGRMITVNKSKELRGGSGLGKEVGQAGDKEFSVFCAEPRYEWNQEEGHTGGWKSGIVASERHQIRGGV